MSACGSCRQPVIWAVTTKGKRIPVDPTPVADGNIVVRDGVAHVVPPGQGSYQSHWVSCPDAARWRKRRRAA